MSEQPYETSQPPGIYEPIGGIGETEPPKIPVHDEPDPTTERDETGPEPDPTANLETFQGPSDSEEVAFGWTDLDKMTDSEKLDEILVLLRAFSDTVGQITALVEQEGIGGLMQKAMTGQL